MRRLTLTMVTILLLLMTFPAAAQGCLHDDGLLRSSLNCTGLPSIPKFFDPSTFKWGSKQFLVVNDGNELVYWDATNPLRPSPRAISNFNVANQGDSDYDLMNYSICDDCRYGIAVYKLGIVIWDQGTGVNPTFGQRYFYPVGQDPRGAFVFKSGGDQYVVAKYLPGDKIGTTATVYKITGVNTLLNVGNIATPGTKIVNGVKVGGIVYLGMMDNWLYTFRVQASGMPLAYLGRSPIRAFLGRGKGFSVSGAVGVSAFLDGAKVWDLTNPAAPVVLSSVGGSYQFAAIGGPFIWIVGQNNIPKTFRVDNPRAPVPLDPAFWDPSNPWNDYGTTCEFPTGGVFSPGGWALYMSRYAVFQQVNFSGCMGAPTPVPTPTPPPWPTPLPTCVPGCTSVDGR
jgi:hypothetical protein